MVTRERQLTATFVALADTLVVGYDIVDLLQTLVDSCAELLDASAAGLLLADDTGQLSVVASTSEQSRLVEIMQLDLGYGPCVECYSTGRAVAVDNIDTTEDRWPGFAKSAIELGFQSLHAVPLRLRGTVIGTLNLFRAEKGNLSEDDAAVAQGLADIATIGILHERALKQSDIAQAQLQYALDSRVRIEQAKGVLSQLHNIDMDAAFKQLRQYARNNGLPLRDVAQQVVERSLSI
jgi:GAF domain-containing protein